MSRQNSTANRDLASVLHPYTNLVRHRRRGPFIVTGGKGVYIWDENGRQYLEGLAGLWCAGLGYNEEALIEAAIKQMRAMPTYHSFVGKTTLPIIGLAEKILEIFPRPMGKVFFANSGSEANDTQIKLVWYYNNALGRPHKKKIISRRGAYHGVTLGAGSLTGMPINHTAFDLPIAGILHTDCPHHYRYAEPDESEEDFATRLTGNLEKLILAEGPDTVAAFIAEPVMGAIGAVPPPRTYFEKVQAILRKYDILFIVDEVICGFGRTGNMFATETYDLQPDSVSFAKMLSAAYMPISAVMVSQQIYDVIADESNKLGTFAHGFTYSGHPVAAAVALRAIELIEERDIVGHVRAVAPRFQRRLHSYASHPLIGEARGVGLMGGLEIVADKATKASFSPAGSAPFYLTLRAEEHGLIARPLSEANCFAPPLIITEREIDELFDRYERSLDDTYAWVKSGCPAHE
ncbi:MAG: aspartate aminotransferase family protein [Alphaproteobacteria bacterium]|nr:aspartate aminotransferase family protein [Alphaproteobacteria bacterium]